MPWGLPKVPPNIVAAVVDRGWENTSQGSAAIPTPERRQAMHPKGFTQLLGLGLAVLFTMLVGRVGADDSKLEGTWDVTLQFPEETCNRPECNCPANTPNIPIPALNTVLKGGGMLWSGSALAVVTGQGGWERLGHNHYMARFKFYIFNPETGFRMGYEELAKDIRVTGPETFEASTTYDLFDAADQLIGTGCLINETATRFE
jgi:hypothetical protein